MRMTTNAYAAGTDPATNVTRSSPLLEREGKTTLLRDAPAPWVLRRCEETGFVFLENPPGYASLQDEYAWEQTYNRETAARAAAEPARHAVSAGLKRIRRQVLKRNKIADITVELVSGLANSPQIRLLDLGCGWGALLGEVITRLPQDLRRRCHPHGIEISTELARWSEQAMAPLGGHCVHAPALEGLDRFEQNFFDVVVMASFLEHEMQPLPLLRRCYQRLKPGGYVVVKVPNYDCWNRHLRGARWCGYRWPDHVNYFTAATLRAMAQAAGLEIARMRFADRSPLSDSLYAVLRKPL